MPTLLPDILHIRFCHYEGSGPAGSSPGELRSYHYDTYHRNGRTDEQLADLLEETGRRIRVDDPDIYFWVVPSSDFDLIYRAWGPDGEFTCDAWYAALGQTPPTSNPSDPSAKVHMIKTAIKRVGGKLMLLVDARDFQAELDKLGCQHDGSRYLDRPAAATQICDSQFRMSTEVLLKREYRDVEYFEMVDGSKVVRTMPVSAAFDLSGQFASPPSFDNLKKICSTADAAARKILEHYQPIDIQIEIHKKVVRG